ncbi:MAG: diguanylate cyclase [Proteobacteria bacterium]|nr:diguanylate cyclase [Pseudomonadota bacterium]
MSDARGDTSPPVQANGGDFVVAILDEVTRGGRGSVRRAIESALAGQDHATTPLYRAFVAIGHGSRCMNEGRYEESLVAILPALEELERSPYSHRLGWLHNMVGFAVGMMGNPERGLEWTARAVASVGATPASVDSLAAYSNHGCLLGMVGAHDASKDALERSRAIAESRGDVGAHHIALSNIGYGLLVRLRESPALDGDARRALGTQALDYARRAAALTPAPELGLDPAGASSLLGQALLETGDVAGAKAKFADALRLGPSQPPVAADLQLGLATAHRLTGDFATARGHLGRAHDIATQGQLALVLNRVLAEGIALERAAGDTAATLDWTTRRCQFLELHYRQRLQMLARSNEFAAQARAISERASHYQLEAAALNTRIRDWDDERLRDGVTLAYNRRGLARVAGHVFAPFRTLATAVVDIDDFATINDRHGTAAGDAVLKQIAGVIGARLRSADQFARAEGAEFQLLLLDTSPSAARETCEQIRIAVENGRWIADAPDTRVTVSIGICNRTTQTHFDATLAAADVALAAAQRTGGNRTCVA